MIDGETLRGAIKEAERFIKAAKNLEKCYHAPQLSVKSAACKRASLDLTRKLADLRQGR